ncbi:DUF6094 domain-containing protein [Pseudoalteromonas luteoviolacea]|uniref:DUF6094 domain-containing protein n=1 Tax=Pseudoalteromonas luteoviolacea S4060-1 TaxID=1365257 RepID=A0A167KWI5_9GAMM|nr:DUF6094 domain-containing protein [Pseudoalteromonas luteoviolacea]KZN63404.1 hypothetical protein N478_03885 [Pseudoalteromonas luteoviolacea S4060-1]
MATNLMFQRIAHNYAKKGFYPTDIDSITRILNFLDFDLGFYRIVDPSIGEGHALSEIKNALTGCEVESYGIELDKERAKIAESCTDLVLHSDYFQTSIENNAFDLMLFNPPYGDLVTDSTVMHAGEKRLEKKFFRTTVGLLRNGGLSIMLLQYSSLDKNFAERIARNFEDIQIFKAADETYKQVIIFGRKRKSYSAKSNVVKAILEARNNIDSIPVIPELAERPYRLKPFFKKKAIRFHTFSVTQDLVKEEMERNSNLLWSDFDSLFDVRSRTAPKPVMMPSSWHMAMAVVAGCVSGVVDDGNEQYLIKGSVRKVIKKSSETNSYDSGDGDIQHEFITREVERYEAEIVGINFSTNSANFGEVVVIR